jgi:hypothetical protein
MLWQCSLPLFHTFDSLKPVQARAGGFKRGRLGRLPRQTGLGAPGALLSLALYPLAGLARTALGCLPDCLGCPADGTAPPPHALPASLLPSFASHHITIAPDSSSPHLLGSEATTSPGSPPARITTLNSGRNTVLNHDSRLSPIFNTRHGILIFIILLTPHNCFSFNSKPTVLRPLCLCGHAAILLTIKGPLHIFPGSLLTADT